VVLPVIGVFLRLPYRAPQPVSPIALGSGAPRMSPAAPDNYLSYGLWNSYSAFGGMAKPDTVGRGGRNTV